MRLFSVVETQDTYYDLEMAMAADKLVNEVLAVQAGQTVLFTADTKSDMRVVHACAKAVFVTGGIPIVLHYYTLPDPQMNPPKPVADAVASADIWVEFAVSYIMYTETWHHALQSWCAVCVLAGDGCGWNGALCWATRCSSAFRHG